MWLPILALIIGFLVVLLPSKLTLPRESIEYIGIAVVAGFDSVVGAIRSALEGRFSDRIFVGGFFTNTVIAVLILYLGNWLGIQYTALAIMVALFIRIFNNLGFIRRYIVARLFEKRISAENFPEP